MTDNQTLQSRESATDLPIKAISVLSRRELLKHAVFTGSMSAGGVATGGVASAVKSSEGPDTTTVGSEVLDDDAETSFDKALVVKGTGVGTNSYQFSISDAITSDGVVKAQLRDSDGALVTGEVQKGRTDKYLFIGKVTDVSARGSITYHIYE